MVQYIAHTLLAIAVILAIIITFTWNVVDYDNVPWILLLLASLLAMTVAITIYWLKLFKTLDHEKAMRRFRFFFYLLILYMIYLKFFR